MADDSELLRRYAERGDQAAFTELVARRYRLVLAAALRQLRGDQAAAADIAQGVFTDLARKAPKLTGHTSLMGWLYTSTWFAAKKRQREEGRRLAALDRAAVTAAADVESPRSEAPIDWRAVHPLLDDAMNRLGGEERDALLNRFFAEKSFVELSQASGLTPSGERMKVDRALERLRRLLARRGVTSTTAALAAVLGEGALGAPLPAGAATAVAAEAIAAAQASMAAGAAASLFVMSKLTTALAAGALAAAGAGLYLAYRAHAYESLAATADQRPRDSSPAFQPDSADRPLSAAAPRSAKPAAVHLQKNLKDVSTAVVQQSFAEDPQVRRLLARWLTARFRLQYAPLFERLRLTAAQQDQLVLLNLKEASELEDLQEAARQSGAAEDAPPDAALVSLQAQVQSRYDQAVVQLLGDSDAAQFQAYTQTLPARQMANQAAAASAYSPSPMTAAQTEALTQLIASQAPAPTAAQPLSLDQVNWPSVFNQARGLLSPQQLTVLQSVRAASEAEALEDQLTSVKP